MSHATYAFLIDLDPELEPEELAAEAKSILEYRFAEHHTDENNWYQEEALVMGDGRVVSMCPAEDWRGRDGLFKIIDAMPQAERWEWARLFSLQCVANEFELGGRSPIGLGEREPDAPFWDRFDSLLDRILTEMPPKLAELWGQGALLRGDAAKDDNFLPRWHRRKWSMQVSHLLQSIDNKCPPFAETGGLTPYDYRAFDLTEDGSHTTMTAARPSCSSISTPERGVYRSAPPG